MKKHISMLLVMLFLLAGCSGCTVDAPPADMTSSSTLMEPQTPERAAQDGLALIEDAIGGAVHAEDMQVASVLNYGDETVVKYAQTYKGVEIYGASMVAVSGEENFVGGTYYDVTDAFDEDFESLVQQAEKVPDWMLDTQEEEGVTIVYHTDTLQPVIYPTAENKAVVARCVQVTLTSGEEACTIELVCDMEGKTWYAYSTDAEGYEDAVLNGVNIVQQDGVYYAYSPDAKAYIFYKSTLDDTWLAKFTGSEGGKIDLDLMHVLGEDDDADNEALEVLGTFARVETWYREKFGHVGVDGKGGTSIIVTGVDIDKLGSIAANGGKYGYSFYTAQTKYGQTVADAPEIMAHEYAHGVLKNAVGLLSGPYQSGCLHEAISDAFACLFDPDGDWKIGEGAKGVGTRDIANSSYTTMDDFQWDYEFDGVGDSYEEMLWDGFDDLMMYLRKKVIGDERCGVMKYSNSMIVSHTLYNIWKDVFQKDDDLFGRVLYASLRYLPSNADYADFRDAFMFATGRLVNKEAQRRSGTAFDVAGIMYEKDNYVRMEKQEKQEAKDAKALLDMTYSEIKQLPWASCGSFSYADIPDCWFSSFEMGDVRVSLSFENSEQEDPDAYPYAVDVIYCGEGEQEIAILPGLSIGMTYGEIQAVFDVSPLENTEYGGTEIPVLARMTLDSIAVELYFDYYDIKNDDDAVLYSVLLQKE